MRSQEDQAWYHVDVNSAYLGWTATYRVCILEEDLDLRDIPSIIGGSEAERHGIILTKSGSARRYGIRIGETLTGARCKCPGLAIVSPDYSLYVGCSKVLVELPKKYFPHVHQYSIDEAFCRVEGTKGLQGTHTASTHQLKEEIRRELGFTVNIGVSDCKLLARMASEFQKPGQIHTLFTREIRRKVWPLSISDLFQAGPAMVRKLGALRIRTIRELAVMDLELLKGHLRRRGEFIRNYANGRDVSPFLRGLPRNKGYGNSMTTPFDMTDREMAWQVVLSLMKTVCTRLRANEVEAAYVGISVTDREFRHDSIQTTLVSATNTTLEIYEAARSLSDRLQNYSPIRRMGVCTNKASPKDHYQYQPFDRGLHDRYSRLDTAADEIRKQCGEDYVQKAVLVENRIPHMSGGIDKVKRTRVTKAVQRTGFSGRLSGSNPLSYGISWRSNWGR